MIATIIHNGTTGVDNKKQDVATKMSGYQRTSHIGVGAVRYSQHIQYFEKKKEEGKKIDIIFFIGLTYKERQEVKANIGYPVYCVKIGSSLKDDSSEDAVLSIEAWNSKNFLANYVHS